VVLKLLRSKAVNLLPSEQDNSNSYSLLKLEPRIQGCHTRTHWSLKPPSTRIFILIFRLNSFFFAFLVLKCTSHQDGNQSSKCGNSFRLQLEWME